jgi:hypothetical protein
MKANLRIDWLASQKEFPHFELIKPNKNKLDWDFTKLHPFYTSRGYFIYRTSIDRFVPIRIIDNIVKLVGKKELTDEILNFLLSVDGCQERYHQFALKKIKEATSDDFLITLPEKQVHFRKDKHNAMQLYFQNCIVKITATNITTHPYTKLDGLIWESQILNREYIASEISDKGDWANFISNISKADPKRVSALCTSLGFYLHNYKSAAYCPAIILNDEVMSDNPEGGTGKGLFFRAIAQFVKLFRIDGKTFSFDKNFIYQGVSPDTKLIFFDDVKKSFDFERLFSVITEGIAVEKKGKDEIYIDFENSPKIGVSTNYALRGTGNSHDRRKHELEITQYYTKKFRPDHEFGHMMFTGWDDFQWQQFDNYMVMCCQLYLNNGLIEQELINLPEKKMIAETDYYFLEFMEDRKFTTIKKSDFFNEFIREYPEKLKDKYFTKQKLSKWLRVYADYMGYDMPVKDYIYASERYYTFTKKLENQE